MLHMLAKCKLSSHAITSSNDSINLHLLHQFSFEVN